MNLSVGLSVGAAVLAAVAFFLRDMTQSKSVPDRQKPASPLMAYAVLAILVALAILGGIWRVEYFGLAVGLGVGAVAIALSYAVGLMPNQNQAGRAFPIALGTLAVAVLPLVPFPNAPLAAVFGAAAAAWLLSFNRPEEPNFWGIRAALVLAAVMATNQLAVAADKGEYAAHAGTLFGLLLAFAALIASALPKLRPLLMAAVFALGGWLIGDRLLISPDLLMVVAGGAVLTVVVHYLLNDEISSSLRQIVAVVIWVAAGTAAFGFERGFGMSTLLLLAVGLLVGFGNQVSLASVGPLGALVLYRVFRENHLEATRAFDIGQHYAMIGILVGLALPVLAQEWQRESAGKTKYVGGVAGGLWIVTLATVPIAAAVLLGAKGVVGYLFGLGLASVVEVLRGDRTAHPVGLGLGLSALMTLAYEPIAPLLQMDREGRVQALAWILGGLVIVGFLIGVLSGEFKRPKGETEKAKA